MSSDGQSSPLVSTEWLKSQIDAGNDNLRVFDATWASDKDAYEEYKTKHIPGAGYFGIFHGVSNTTLFPRNIPEADVFESYVRSLGVNKTSHVVVYDNTALGGMFVASRAWWLFRLHGHDKVSVLEGGLQKWIKDGNVTDNVEANASQGDFTANVQSALLRNFDDVVGNTKKQDFQVCDTRSVEQFRGKSEEKQTGHVPHATSVPFRSALLTSDGSSLRPKEELLTVFQEAGIDLSRPLVGMCNSGMSSCSLVLAANLCGASDYSLYLGGFTEWKNRADDSLLEKS